MALSVSYRDILYLSTEEKIEKNTTEREQENTRLRGWERKKEYKKVGQKRGDLKHKKEWRGKGQTCFLFINSLPS